MPIFSEEGIPCVEKKNKKKNVKTIIKRIINS
jgi:hypothetical protein